MPAARRTHRRDRRRPAPSAWGGPRAPLIVLTPVFRSGTAIDMFAVRLLDPLPTSGTDPLEIGVGNTTTGILPGTGIVARADADSVARPASQVDLSADGAALVTFPGLPAGPGRVYVSGILPELEAALGGPIAPGLFAYTA